MVAHKFVPQDWVALEVQTGQRHEVIDGTPTAMAGGSPRHGRLCANLVGIVFSALRGRICHALTSDTPVAVASDTYFYPDLSVVCGKGEYAETPDHSLLNPTAVAEILSPTTEANDRGRKSHGYRSIASVQEILLVSSDRVAAELTTRQPNGTWVLRTFEGADALVRLESIEVEFPLRELYEGIEWEPTEAGRAESDVVT